GDGLGGRVRGQRTRRSYRVAQAIRIQTRQLDTIEKVSTRVTELIERGIDVAPEPPEYISTELRTAKLEALRAATVDARERAQTLVDGLGGKLGRLRATSLGVYQITPRFSTQVTD